MSEAQGDEQAIGQALRRLGWSIAVAETETGGLIAARLIGVPGSSAYMRGAVVAYANQAKLELLGLPPGLLAEAGVVSAEAALALAQAARRVLHAELGLATTGIAGPPDPSRRSSKPVGLAYIAAAWPTGQRVEQHQWPSHDRQRNMASSTAAALALALAVLRQQADR
jgi:PncC family amidohydrolase